MPVIIASPGSVRPRCRAAGVYFRLDQWTAQPGVSNHKVYAGTALRTLAAEVARSEDHDLFDLLPTHRSSIGYRRGRTNYAVHPDVSFTLDRAPLAGLY